MFIGNYARVPIKCSFCKGKGCNSCANTGKKERSLLLISEEPLTVEHLQRQQQLKDIQGEILKEEKKPLVEKDKE